jgi:hypothetical protein
MFGRPRQGVQYGLASGRRRPWVGLGRAYYHVCVAAEESTKRWAVGIAVAVVGIVVSSLVTLGAADRLHCPAALCGSVQPSPTRTISTVDEKAAMSLSPASGPVTTVLKVTLTGFAPYEFVTITFGGYRISDPQMDASGAAAGIAIPVPSSFASMGEQVMTLAGRGDSSARVATATFQLTSA